VIDQITHARCGRGEFLQQLQPLRDQLLNIRNPGDIAAGPVSALHQPHCDRIRDMNKDDRDGRGRLLRDRGGTRVRADEYVDPTGD
jgi:hypothetical protein